MILPRKYSFEDWSYSTFPKTREGLEKILPLKRFKSLDDYDKACAMSCFHLLNSFPTEDQKNYFFALDGFYNEFWSRVKWAAKQNASNYRYN